VAGTRRENARFNASLRTIEACDDERRRHQRELETINYERIHRASLSSDVGIT